MTIQSLKAIQFKTKQGLTIAVDDIDDLSEEQGYERLTVTYDLMHRLVSGHYIEEMPDGSYRWQSGIVPNINDPDDVETMFGCLIGVSEDELACYSMSELEQLAVAT